MIPLTLFSHNWFMLKVQHLCLKCQRVLKSLSGLLAKAGSQAPTQMLSHCSPPPPPSGIRQKRRCIGVRKVLGQSKVWENALWLLEKQT